MPNSNQIRIYNLASDLKQDTKRIIEDLQREGAKVEVPSNSVSIELAEKIRNRYFPKTEVTPKQVIKVIKKDTNKVIMPYLKDSIDISQKQKICEYCSKVISSKRFAKNYKEHILNECPEKPVFSVKNILKYFDLMTEKANFMNNRKLSSIDFALFLIDSQSISNFYIGYSLINYFTEDYATATVVNDKKKLKI